MPNISEIQHVTPASMREDCDVCYQLCKADGLSIYTSFHVEIYRCFLLLIMVRYNVLEFISLKKEQSNSFASSPLLCVLLQSIVI